MARTEMAFAAVVKRIQLRINALEHVERGFECA